MYKRVLTIQDISCLGQCSLTVALPVISACGAETCVLPSALLSTHTMSFEGYTCLDLSDEIRKILAHWREHNVKFDAVYTGYLADVGQIDIVRSAFKACLTEGGLKIVDPVMGDYGKLYPAFDREFVKAMRRLVSEADIVLPNITEACLLTDEEYKEQYDAAYIVRILDKLISVGAKKIVLTGVGYDKDTTGVVVYDGTDYFYYSHPREARSCHGTGDLFASAFTGALMNGKTAQQAARIAANYIVDCIKNTPLSHWYGVRFEPCISNLINALRLD